MHRKRILWIILASLVALVALALILAAFLPFGELKSLADALKPNGNFKSLKESNVLVFKILMGVTGLVLLALALGIGSGRLGKAGIWFNRYFSDSAGFFKTLNPARFDLFAVVALLLILAAAVVFRLVHIKDGMSHDEAYTFIVFSSTSLFNIVTN